MKPNELIDRPWEDDPDFYDLTPEQRIIVGNVLDKVILVYIGGRRIGKTVMYNFILKWLNNMEAP